MKRPISILVSGFLLLVSSTIPAQIDTNANNLSDLWEQNHNSGDLFPNTFDPAADPDKDGWTNAQEAAAGTDPFDPNPPNGFLRPDIINIPAVFDEPASNGDPVLLSPSAIRVSWQTFPGKKYTLLYSPNLESTSWLPVEEPFIGTDGVTEYNFPLANPTKTFWRVKIEDTDSDGDGLTDAEENQLGLNAANPDTDGDGVPDKVEIANRTDPKNPDTDGDGLTDGQEIELDTDPKVPDNPGILQETIKNGDFSDPVIGTGARANASWKKWDYWFGVPGWTAVIGNNVEYQIIEPLVEGNQYCEIKAEPAGNHGIQQTIGTVKDKTYLIVMDCKARADTDLADNAFDIRTAPGSGPSVTWTTIKSVTFADKNWTTTAVTFKAETSITSISLIPTNLTKPTRGGLVDNLRFFPVDLKIVRRAEENLAVGTIHLKNAENVWDTTIVTRKKDLSVNDPEDVLIEVTGVPEELKSKISWVNSIAESTNSIQAKVSRNTVGDIPISVRVGTTDLATATLKVVWGTANVFNQDTDTKPEDCDEGGWLPNEHRPGIAYGTWNRMVGQFVITPASLRTVAGTKFVIESRIVKGAGWVYYKRQAYPAGWTFDADGLSEDKADGPIIGNTDSTLSEQGNLYYADMPGWQNPPPANTYPNATRAAQKVNFTHTVYVEMPQDRGGSGTRKLRIAEFGKWHTVSFCKKQANGEWERDNDPGTDNSIGAEHKPFTWNEQAP